MNILFLSRDYPPKDIGGVGTYVCEITRLLAKMGHGIFIITEAAGRPLEYIDNGVRVLRVAPGKLSLLDPIREVLKGFVERLEYSWAVSKKIREVVRCYNIDVVESSEARAEGLLYYVFNKRPPLVVRLHTPEGMVYHLNRDRQSRVRSMIEVLEKWWICRADKITGPSRAVIGLTERYCGAKLRGASVAPNPLDAGLFRSKEDPDERHDVLYAGRLEFRKGVHILIRAIPRVLKKAPRARFILIGEDCGMKSYLMNKAQCLGIAEHVKFIGKVSRAELIDYYQRSALCVLPSLWENHPYAALEAMACGRPVIASNIGGISEIITDGANGALVRPGSCLELSDAIVKGLNDRRYRADLGMGARRYVEKEYTPAATGERAIEVYSGLTGD